MNTQSKELLPKTPFERVRVTIVEGAWKGEEGWITGPKNEVGANPITTDKDSASCGSTPRFAERQPLDKLIIILP